MVFRLTKMASSTGAQIEKSPLVTLISKVTTSSPPMIPATPGSELGMYILSVVTTAWAGNVARHTYWASLFAIPCVIVPLALVAKETDQVAEQVVCCPTQAGFVNQGEANGHQGD